MSMPMPDLNMNTQTSSSASQSGAWTGGSFKAEGINFGSQGVNQWVLLGAAALVAYLMLKRK